MSLKHMEDAAYLFNRGENQKAYEFLGAHYLGSTPMGERYRFAVWAPNARFVSVVGDFNGWVEGVNPLERFGTSGIWYTELDNLQKWQRYKYAIVGSDNYCMLKADPYARHAETRPGTASILYHEEEFPWSDAEWLAKRKERLGYDRPLNIYEMHLGSWRRHQDGSVYNYRDLAEQLAEYLQEMGYNAVEFMPLTEYPLDMSWGYQVTGYFAPTSRYGTPEDLKYLINYLHNEGIAVLLDWVPAHFPKDAFALASFDGGPTYEYADSRIAEHQEWGTLVFDYERTEVRSFLFSSADFWLSEFHFDGLRVDAVSSMIYINFGRDQDIRNVDGGEENYEAISFLQELNERMHQHYPGVLMIAEESTAWPKVTAPVAEGGLGFTHKWNMGWMNDTLSYFKRDFVHRTHHHDQLTFSMTYAFSEHFLLALSHDEVVHGKGTLLQKMPGDYWRQFAGLRTLFAYQMTHPGHKLNFMGNEIAPYTEWRYYEEIEWFMLNYDSHRQVRDFVRDLNHLYLEDPAFWAVDQSWDGYRWLQVDDVDNELFAYLRNAPGAQDKVVILNLTPRVFPEYRLPIHRKGEYRLILNSDSPKYGGSGYLEDEEISFPAYCSGRGSELIDGGACSGTANILDRNTSEENSQCYLKLSVPPLCALILERAADSLDDAEEPGKKAISTDKDI
ncbi:MAG: 1,4-alpha-glucan branching protein GlgB [Eubacteriales bacterium]|nr:1,4-alpha-glucan branching protein GlgB [Eubacteriales bacterium]